VATGKNNGLEMMLPIGGPSLSHSLLSQLEINREERDGAGGMILTA